MPPITREDFQPKSWNAESEQTTKEGKKHALVIKTSQELIAPLVIDCNQKATDTQSPLALIDEAFKGGSESKAYNGIKAHKERTWGLIYHLADAFIDYRDTLDEENQKDIEPILENLLALWKNIKDSQAREDLLKNMTDWLKKPPSIENIDNTGRMLEIGYFVLNGLSSELSTFGSIEKSIASRMGVDLGTLKNTLDISLKPLVAQKYQQISLIKKLSTSPENAFAIIASDRENAAKVLLSNIKLTEEILKRGDQAAKIFILNNDALVAKLISEDRKNIYSLIEANPKEAKTVFEKNTKVRDQIAILLGADLDFTKKLAEDLLTNKQLSILEPIFKVNSKLALKLSGQVSSDSELSQFLKPYVKLSDDHVKMIQGLGGNVNLSLSAIAENVAIPDNTTSQKKALQATCERLQTLDKILSLDDSQLVIAFWEEYNTQEKLDTLKSDLSSLSEANKTNLQRHFRSVFVGGITGIFVSAYSWVQTTANPELTGGVPPLSGILRGAVKDALSSSQQTLQNQALEIMPTFVVSGESTPEKLNCISNVLKGETNAEIIIRLTDELKSNLDNLPSTDIFTADSVSEAMSISVNLFNSANTDKLDKLAEYQRVLRDFDSALAIIDNHQRMVDILKQIASNINQLEEKGVDVVQLRQAFDRQVKDTIKHGGDIYKSIPTNSSAKIMIDALQKDLTNAKTSIQLNRDGSEKLFKVIRDNKDTIEETRKYLQTRSSTWAHFFMNIFSPSYRAMYKNLKETIEQYDNKQISEPVAVKAIQKTITGDKGYDSEKIAGIREHIAKSPTIELDDNSTPANSKL
jgi:tetratricopeptide (TPR) repeat protein